MFMYVFSIIIVVASSILYHICQKSTPQKADPFFALFATYAAAALITIIAFIFSKSDKGFFSSFADLNWASAGLAFAIVGLEFGFLMAYRAGWKISMGALVANITISLILIPIGILFFKEGFGPNKIIGAALCIVGLILINK